MRLSNIKLFIDSGWRTIPYQKIFYNENGKKETLPAVRWSEYLTKFNAEATPAGAVICDSVLVIDCDTLEATDRFLKIANIPNVETHNDLTKPNLNEHLGLVVKTSRGYHFYFKNDGTFKDCKEDKIDILATNKKICYLPTNESAGKEIVNYNLVFEGVQKFGLYPPTKEIREWIYELNTKAKSPEGQIPLPNQKKLARPLGTPLVQIPKGTTLFYKRLTPKSLRDLPIYRDVYLKKGFLEPDDIQDGDGNSYLIAIAGILCCEISVDTQAFWEIMEFINSKWSNPLTHAELTEKVKGYVENNYPECPFVYDALWEQYKCSFIDVDGNDINMVYDLKSSKYVITNLTTWETFTKNTQDAVSFYCNRTRTKVSGSTLASVTLGVNTIFNPTKPFGLQDGGLYNTYKHSKFLEILNGEGEYTKEEIENAKNNKVLPFIEHLFRKQKTYFLRYLKTKLTGFKYSPVAFCLFDDEGGAGKGVLEVLLGKFVGDNKVTKIPYETFKSKFTSEYEGRLFVFLNEYPSDLQSKRFNTDKIKEITGSPRVKIEKKGCDPYDVQNFTTLFITSNRVSIEIREGDRRFCVVQCYDKFDHVFPSGYFDLITSEEELTKFAIYLRYSVYKLDHSSYVSPPISEAKELFIDVNESDLDKCVRFIAMKQYNELTAFSAECLVYTGDESAINLTLLAESLGAMVRTLTTEIKKKQGQKKIEEGKIFKDTNKKFDKNRCCTYLMLAPKALNTQIGFLAPSNIDNEPCPF